MIIAERYKDIATGIIFILIGGVFLWGSMALPSGSITDMGPGFLPASVSIMLMLVGAVLLFKGVFWKY